MTERFLQGLRYPALGLRLLWQRTELWPWVALPTLISSGLLSLALYTVVYWTDDVVATILPAPAHGTLAHSLWLVLVFVVGILLLLVLGVLAWIASGMIASPFYDVMAEQTETLLLGPHDEPFDLRTIAGDTCTSVRHSIFGLVLYGASSVTLLLFELVPGVGTLISAVTTPLLAIFFVCREVMDVPLSRRRMGFLEKLRFLFRHRVPLAGLGASSTLLLAIPLVNLVSMPIAVLGATLLYCHLEL